MSKLKEIDHPNSQSKKEYIRGRKAPLNPSMQNRTALYLRVSTADQKPDLNMTAFVITPNAPGSMSSESIWILPSPAGAKGAPNSAP